MSGNYEDILELQRLRGLQGPQSTLQHSSQTLPAPPHLCLNHAKPGTLPDLQPHCPCSVASTQGPVMLSLSPACFPGGSSTCWCLLDPNEQVPQWSTWHPLGRLATASESRMSSLPAYPSALVSKPPLLHKLLCPEPKGNLVRAEFTTKLHTSPHFSLFILLVCSSTFHLHSLFSKPAPTRLCFVSNRMLCWLFSQPCL